MLWNNEFVREVGPVRWGWRTLRRQFSKRVLAKDSAILLPSGLTMILPRNSQFASEVFLTRSNVDWGSEKLFSAFLDPRGVFLDIGANVGYYSLYMLPIVSAVHAFEPDSKAREWLTRNLCFYEQAHVHGTAVSDCVGEGKFTEADNSEVSHLSPEGNPVQTTTIDAFVQSHNISVTGIKIDVEGSDLAVIRGARRTLDSQAPLVLTESTPDGALFDLLPLGYSVFAFVKNSHGFVFRQISKGDAARTKMLFLVPQRLHGAFFPLSS